MTDLPKKIWAKDYAMGCPEDRDWMPNDDVGGTQYTRTDVADAREVAAINLGRYFADTANTQQARIKELESALRSIGNEVSIARAALKGE